MYPKLNPVYLRTTAFSLIELIVVVLILGVLAAAASLKLFDYLGKSKVTQAKTDLQTISKAIELYRMDKGSYPEELPMLMGEDNEDGTEGPRVWECMGCRKLLDDPDDDEDAALWLAMDADAERVEKQLGNA